MNKAFKIILNRSTGIFVVVSENARGVVKSKVSKIGSVIIAAAIAVPLSHASIETGISNGGNNLAIGNDSLTTGSNSIALGKGSTAIGSDMSINQVEKMLREQASLISNISSLSNSIDRNESQYKQHLQTVEKLERNYQTINEYTGKLNTEKAKLLASKMNGLLLMLNSKPKQVLLPIKSRS